ncbi:hypothetical protein BJY00DRAFT_293174 [Aspergillus carlsbadensis]|nr:hypothetical protein BJY00DRAFT_293174 [Aspergillus carlsbadensis]
MGFGKIGLVILLASRASSTCYYRDGTIAEEDEPCPNSNICCPSGGTCLDNLLCRDENNFLNGSTVTFPGGTYNYTDLYHTSSCQSQSYDGCSVQCTTHDSDSGKYIWACDSTLTSYCCHSDAESLAQYDCCQNGTFSLATPSQSTSTTSTTSTTSSPTLSSSTATVSTTASMTADQSPLPTATNTTEPQLSSSLSTGAKAGIGVGISVLGIVSISLAVVLVCSRRKRVTARVSEKGLAEMPSGLYNIPEMDNTARPPELGSGRDARRVYELG